jgi:hypothetical protein
MRPELLAEHEQALVESYAEEVTRLGAPLSADHAWDGYRAFSFQTLMTAVVSLGLGSFTDSDAIMWTMLERSVAATRRVDFAGWLDALVASSESSSRPENSPEASDSSKGIDDPELTMLLFGRRSAPRPGD